MVSFEAFRHIGDTPLVRLELGLTRGPTPVMLKLEGSNPGGSIKDRTGVSLVRHLEQIGRLYPGSILVESTSGNLRVALAMIAQSSRYHFVGIVDPNASPIFVHKIRGFGAHIEFVDNPDQHGSYLESRIGLVKDLCRRNRSLV